MKNTIGGATPRCEARSLVTGALRARIVLGTLAGMLALSISPYAGAQTTQPASQASLQPASQPPAQPASQPPAQPAAQPVSESASHPASRAQVHVHWQLLVLLDGHQVDSFSGDTAVGQSQTVTHHHAASHPVGCEGAQTVPADLSRTISVSPLGVDSNNVIGFEISADDVIEDSTARAVQGTGCALPPQTRTISARHPELDVASGKTNEWVLLKKQPQLIYRLSASVAPPAASP